MSFLAFPVAAAEPVQGARITGTEQVTDRWIKVSVYSPSTDTVVVNEVFRAPGSAPAPVFYLLDGIDGGLDNKGQYSYYTDWVADDPVVGRKTWQTSVWLSVHLRGNQSMQIMLSLLPGGANAANMWGPAGSPEWIAHDPAMNAAKLNGVAVYAAGSTGAVGPVDNLPPDFPTSVGGQLVEGITLECTRQFADAAKGVAA